MQSERDLCLREGMNDFVTKPYTMSKLVQVVAKWLPDYPIQFTKAASLSEAEAETVQREKRKGRVKHKVLK